MADAATPTGNAGFGNAINNVDDVVERIGLGRFQWRLLGVNGLVWAGDAMEVIGIGFILPSVIATFGVSGAQVGLVGSLFLPECSSVRGGSGRSPTA